MSDYKATALEYLDVANRVNISEASAAATVALAYATLALVEEQRTANLLTAFKVDGQVDLVSYACWLELRTEVRERLGLSGSDNV